MSDNTQLVVPSTGTVNQDVVRTIDRSADSVPIAAKTQVVQLDVGGETNESLVTAGNPMPVSGTITANQGGTWSARVVGSAGATLDATVGAAAAPTNGIAVLGVYDSSPPAPTNGQSVALQLDSAGNLRSFGGIALTTLAAQGTALNSTQTIIANGASGAQAAMVQLTQTTTLTAGAVTFEVTYDGTNWATVPAAFVVDPTSSTFAPIAIPYTVQASTNKQFVILLNGATGLRIRTSTAITGTGTVTPNFALLNYQPLEQVSVLGNVTVNALPAGTNAIGQVSVSPVSGQGWPSTYSGSIGATVTSVKSSAGTLGAYYIYNANTSVVYVQIFDLATGSVTLGTTAPKWSIGIPASGAANLEFVNGLKFSTAITIAVTTTRAGSTAPSSTVDVNLAYG